MVKTSCHGLHEFRWERVERTFSAVAASRFFASFSAFFALPASFFALVPLPGAMIAVMS